MERIRIFERAGRTFSKRRRPLCADAFAHFPTIADLYEEQAMRRATRAARRDALIATIEERAATLPPGPI